MIQHISSQERTIMQAVWDAGENYPTTRDIESYLRTLDGVERNISSLITVLARLVDKGYLNPVKKHRKSIYFEPIITEMEYKAYVTKEFMDGVHRGKFSSLASALLKNSQYTQNDIDELRRILNQGDSHEADSR